MKPLRLKLLIPIISAVLLSACGADSPSGLTPTLTRLPRTATTQPTRTATPTVVATATQTPRPTATELGNWIEPIASQPPLSRATTSADERASFAELERINPPALNEPALAAALGRDIPLGASRVPISYTVGYSDTFIIPAIATGEIIEHELVLARISDQAYFWFDPSYELDPAAMDEVTSGFEILFTAVQNFFGPTRQAGLDGDRRVHIVNVSRRDFLRRGRSCLRCGRLLPTQQHPAP